MINRAFTLFLSVFLITTFPLSAEAQDSTVVKTANCETSHEPWEETIPGWDKIQFNSHPAKLVHKNEYFAITKHVLPSRTVHEVYFNGQYPPGSGNFTDALAQANSRASEAYRSLIVNGNRVVFDGFNDSRRNCLSNTMPVAARNPPESYQSADYRTAEVRSSSGMNHSFANLSEAYTLQNVNRFIPSSVDTEVFMMPDSIQALPREQLGDRLYLMSMRTFRIRIVKFHDPVTEPELKKALAEMRRKDQRRIDGLSGRLDSLARKHSNTRDMAKNNSDRIDSLATEISGIDTGIEFDVFVGGGAESFANLLVPTGKLGLRVGSVELSGWYGYSSGVGTVQLPTEGEKSLNRVSSGSDLSWYVLNTNNFTNGTSQVQLEIGPSVGRVHAEDIISGREQYIRGYDAWLAGVALNFRFGPASLEAKGYRQIAREFDSSDLKFQPHGGNWRVEFGVKLYLNSTYKHLKRLF